MDWDYRCTAKNFGLAIDTVAGDDMSQFPIEKARYRSICLPIVIGSVCTLGYGWSLLTQVVRISLLPRHFCLPCKVRCRAVDSPVLDWSYDLGSI
jgi:hypothetical protein